MPDPSPWQQFLRDGHPAEPVDPNSPWQQFLRGEDPWTELTSWPPTSPWDESPWQEFRGV